MGHDTCPHCTKSDQQVKVGRNRPGSQRYLCRYCQRKYTPVSNPAGYPPDVQQQALAQYVDGGNFRRIARQFNVSHTSVMNWVNRHVASLPDEPPLPEGELTVNELDEVFTFIGAKKTRSTS